MLSKADKLQQLRDKKTALKAAAAKKGDEEKKGPVVEDIREFLVSGSRDKSIKVWDVRTGTMVGELIGHDNWINDLQFHGSGKFLISCSDDKTIRVWDLSNGRNSRTL